MSDTYVVTSDSVGARGKERLVQKGSSVVMEAPTQYFSRGAKVTAEDVGGVERAEKLVERGHLKAEGDLKAEQEAKAKAEADAAEAQAAKEQARMDRLNAEKEAASPATEGSGERLTEKQALQKEAEELGLSTEGKTAELKERIAAKKAEQE